MTMGTIYKGQAGMLAFAKGLDTVSQNIGNLNTAGYKKTDTLFRDLFYQQQQLGGYLDSGTRSQQGQGVRIAGTTIDFSQGELQATGNDTDFAINGNGFFVLRSGDNTYYTRIGQFQFNEDNQLYYPDLDATVMALDENGELGPLDISELRRIPYEATSRITFIDSLSLSSPSHEVDEVEIIDSLGRTQELNFTFERNEIDESPRSWVIRVEDAEGELIAEGLEIRFDEDGLPEEGFNEVSFSYQPEDAGAVDITLDFGEPGSRFGANAGGSVSNLAVDDVDGSTDGSLLSIDVQSDGTVELNYSNDETRDAGKIALAWFDRTQELQQLGGGLFLAPDDMQVIIDTPTQGVMGELVDGNVEISNVEVSQEFTELIILQRGFQGASQTVTVANEMIQQLLQLGRQV